MNINKKRSINLKTIYVLHFRRRKAFQENTVYNDMHMTINNDPNDQYTELDLHKKNTAFENDYENELRVSSDDNAQYMNI